MDWVTTSRLKKVLNFKRGAELRKSSPKMPCCLLAPPDISRESHQFSFNHSSVPDLSYRPRLEVMSDRSRSGSAEGSGDEIRPYGEDHDSSEESEEDPEEARRIAEGFIVDEDDDEEDEEEEVDKKSETKEERRRRKHEAKLRKREQREARKREQQELSDDELDLLNENQGLGGPSHRPSKRARQDEGGDEGDLPRLQDMFADDEGRMADDDDDDDLGDFIEESEDEAGEEGGETEEQRRERKRQEKLKRREAKKAKPDAAGVDKV